MSTSCATAPSAWHRRGHALAAPLAGVIIAASGGSSPSSPAAGSGEGESRSTERPWRRLSDASCRECRVATRRDTSRHATLQLQRCQRLQPPVAQNAKRDTRDTEGDTRRLNSSALNEFGPPVAKNTPRDTTRHTRYRRHRHTRDRGGVRRQIASAKQASVCPEQSPLGTITCGRRLRRRFARHANPLQPPKLLPRPQPRLRSSARNSHMSNFPPHSDVANKSSWPPWPPFGTYYFCLLSRIRKSLCPDTANSIGAAHKAATAARREPETELPLNRSVGLASA
jgi:hypothetical protein